MLFGFTPELYASEAGTSSFSSPVVWILFVALLVLAFLNIVNRVKVKSLMRIQKAVARLPIQCGVCDEQGNIFFYKDTGEAKGNVEPKKLEDLHLELQHELEKALPQLFESDARKSVEFDSYSTRYKIDMIPLPKEDYGVRTALWVVHDVSDLTNAFAERMQMVQLLQNTLSSIGDAVISTNCDGEITLINPSGTHLAGIAENDLLGKPFEDFFRLEDDKGESLIKKVLLTHNSQPFHTELKITGRDTLFVDGLIAPIIEGQLIVGTVLYFHDTTDLVRQGQKLQLALKFAQASDRAKSDFLATVSHEFRSSVNVIIGYCDLSSINSQGNRDPYIDSIHEEAEKLLLMFNDILDVSKNNTETMGITLAPVNLKEISREILRIFSWTSGTDKQPLSVEVDRKLPVILSDYKALRQILMQLLVQAYSLAGNEAVLLTVHWVAHDLIIRISIDSQKVRVKQDKNLSIFRRLCERLNGTLDFKQVQGRLTFEVVLHSPKVVSEDLTSSLPTISEQKVRPHRNVVLLVDDIAVNLKVLGSMLKKLGIESVPCTTARAAMEEIEKYIPLAVFTDLWMPGVGGEELANELRQTPETASIPLVLITADTQLNETLKALFQAVIYKPLKPAELRNVMNSITQLGTGTPNSEA
ncbi:MAG: response regulator [Planctomycetia bacterium]|nr:response regulator [Planctomycetia bacterium]